jgi:PAS domain S-box-containing protein
MGSMSEPGYEVLLAGDDAEVLASVGDYLVRQDGRISTDSVTSVSEATAWLEENRVDCVVSGARLEDGDGIDLLRRVKPDDGETTPFILFVGDGEGASERASEAIEAGATDQIRTTMRGFIAAVEDPGREQQDLLANRITKTVDRNRMRTNYLEVFNKANDAIFVEDPETGEILDVNRRMCEMHGYTREEALGLHVSDVSADEGRFTPEKALENLETAMEEGSHVFEWKNVTKDGETFWVEVSLKSATISGRERILAVVRDISERKEYERLLEEREERFRRVFERHSAPMLLIEPDSGGIVNANEAASRLYGYTRDELTSMSIDEINTLSDEEVERRRKETEKGERDSFVFPHSTKGGDEITVEVNSVPIKTEGGTVLFSIIREKETE